MRLRYTPEARVDILELRRYIAETSGNPGAAARISGEIVRSCSKLKRFPELGMDLARKTGIKTDLRYLICGNRLAFYRIENNYISVPRVLDGRTNYLRLLFGHDIDSVNLT